LISDGGRDTTKQGRLRTGLGESEIVVNEQQHIPTPLIMEVLDNGETSQSDTGTGTRRPDRVLTKMSGDLED
jgi:hypothetical protein